MNSLQNGQLPNARAACEALTKNCQKSIQQIASKNRVKEFEHFEKLLYCYYNLNLSNCYKQKSILQENITNSEKHKRIYELLKNSLENDDQRWAEVYKEYDSLPQRHGFSKFKKTTNTN